jgi:hypothetical protein
MGCFRMPSFNASAFTIVLPGQRTEPLLPMKRAAGERLRAVLF